jgi:hypothetical protein
MSTSRMEAKVSRDRLAIKTPEASFVHVLQSEFGFSGLCTLVG